MAVEVLRRTVTKRAVIFMMSDFQAEGYETSMRVLARKHDVVAIVVSDPREGIFPRVGLVAVRDPETGVEITLDASSPGVRTAYASWAERRRAGARDILSRTGVDVVELSTDASYEKPLVRFFRERARRAVRSGA